VAKDAIMTALSDPLGSKSGTETRNAIKTLILDRQLKGPSEAKTWLVDAEGRAKIDTQAGTPVESAEALQAAASAYKQQNSSALVLLQGTDKTNYNDLKRFISQTYAKPTDAIEDLWGKTGGNAPKNIRDTYGQAALRKMQTVLKFFRDHGDAWHWELFA
jgi:hypothetical protein